MSFFEPISGADFDEKLAKARQTQDAMIIDVRSAAEVAEGYIPGAVNIPLKQIAELDADKQTPLFLYSHSGQQSVSGCKLLETRGYTNVTNLGGIVDYKGPLDQ